MDRIPIPIYDATAPIACTLSGEEVSARLEQIERVRTYLDRLERTPHGLLLHFPNRPEIDAELHRFAVDEKQCCGFWGFEVQAHDEQLTLRWDGPPEVDDIVGQLAAFFEGDLPLSSVSELL